ncbi:MAG: hypothetical protein OXB98_00335 [Bryobacterales bacterium]|nr:hypothetical protein [Bryobacterales bacterium]
MDIATLSLIATTLAVFIGPMVSWRIATRQITTSSALARDQMRASSEASSKQITAPMRQAWINNLRDLLAELTSSSLHYYVSGYEDRSDEDYQRVTLLVDKIQFMLNPNENDHQRLEVLIKKMVSSIENRKPDVFPEIHTEVINLARSILKREWDRVKEPMSVEVSSS